MQQGNDVVPSGIANCKLRRGYLAITDTENKMDACLSVERELERLSQKYNNIKEHTDTSLAELSNQISNVQEELSKSEKEATFKILFLLEISLQTRFYIPIIASIV